jgi:hypothetical protein
MPVSSRLLALSWVNSFYPKVFLRSHFSLMILLVIGTRSICLPSMTIPFLEFDMFGSTVFLKAELFLLVRTASFQEPALRYNTTLPLSTTVVCPLIFNKGLEV